MKFRREVNQGRNFGITAWEEGRGELVWPDQKGVAEVVPNGRRYKLKVEL
jgi:hypothetical protein